MASDASSTPKDPVWTEFGRALVREYPDGLGREPNFVTDGNARLIWSMRGFVKFQESMWEVGQFENYRIGGKLYKEYPKDSVDDQVTIAHETFTLAEAYWYYAKKENDSDVEKARGIARVAQEQEKAIAQLTAEVAGADTIQQLEFRVAEIRDNLRTGGNEGSAFLHRQLSTVQKRLIELERESARTNWRWAVAGFVAGAIGVAVGIGFPLWDIMHRPAETKQTGEPTTVPGSPTKPGTDRN